MHGLQQANTREPMRLLLSRCCRLANAIFCSLAKLQCSTFIFLADTQKPMNKKIKELHGQRFTSSKKPTHEAEAALT
jgi:hypothetical protein